ncbi:inositol monophosphatase, partial [Candidatus Woesearchaeota archaeon]|nr:inositol monophosphatase [Candidatus Woesearchaeota archaeon]
MRGVYSNVLKQTAVKAAKEAGKVIQSGFRKQHKVKSKGTTDVVTEIDKKSQDVIFKTIKSRFPDHSFLSEESPKLRGKSDYLWIIDPLDGTANYSSGVPFFCTSICLAYKKELLIGVVFDPLHNEMFVAEKGKGAFLNGKKVTVSKEKNLNRALIGMDSGHYKRSRTVRKVAGFVDFVRGVRWQGAAALSLSHVACGRLNAYFTVNTNAWDVGAGVLLVIEAGGYTSEINGKP